MNICAFVGVLIKPNQRIILKMLLKNIIISFQVRDALQALASMVIKLLLERN